MNTDNAVLVALMADIHANREAFEACLSHARAYRAQQWMFLGDHVNYGADPEWVVETIMDYVSGGAVALLGKTGRSTTRVKTNT